VSVSASSPIVIMFAGPNGAGKTTAATTLFREMLQPIDFINADIIAQGLSGTDPDSVALEAGAIMLARLRALAQAKRSIAFESTGASRTFARWLAELKQAGYEVHIYFFWLASPELAISRVAHRVRLGGHDVPAATIRRRYDRGIRNFFHLYLPLADRWELFDNSALGSPRRIAQGRSCDQCHPEDAILWDELLRRYGA
jgi:predicted ABC-type ATPase